MPDRTYFRRLQAQVFQVGRSCYTIIINVSKWFIVCLGCSYFVWHFGAEVRQNSKKYRWRRCSIQHVRICDLICSNGLWLYLTVIKSHDKRIGDLCDIDIFVQIILSSTALPHTNYLTFNFNGLIFFENSHWLFHLDWLFEIQTDPEFVQNMIW